MLGALGAAFGELAADDTVRVVVLAAAGKAFCAGHDLKEMRDEPSLEYYQGLFGQCTVVMQAIQRLRVPVIPVCTGWRPQPAANSSRCATWRWRAARPASPSAA